MNNQEPMYLFLGETTPKRWFEQVPANLEPLLIDHAHCERKAAFSALKLMQSYPDKIDLVNYASRLAREELVHFERVLKLIKQRGITFRPLSASGYAQAMLSTVNSSLPLRFIETLIIAAFIEARSCERFLGMLPYLEPDIASFYERLVSSEMRHYEQYLEFAKRYAGDIDVEQVCARIRTLENSLIKQPAKAFRFHSGPLA